MNPIVFALRRPITVMMLVLALGLGGLFSVYQMQKDIFPALNQPQLYVIHNYGGMDPKQIEGLITNVYELFFQYINGVEHVESRSIQSMVMLKLYFQPGIDMAEATAQTVAYCNRALSVMPSGSLPPYVVRLDAGSLPVGYLTFESPTRSVGELQDMALFRVRPMFSGLAGISSPPPFGGNVRTIVVNVDPDRLRSYNLSPQDVVDAIDRGNFISPSGNVTIKDQMTVVPANTMVVSPQELRNVPLKLGENVYIRDVGTVTDATDIPVGYALVNGRKSVYLPVVKQASASTLTVVNAVKQNLPRFQSVMPDDVKVSYEFDESPIVYRAIESVGVEGALGAGPDRAHGAAFPARLAGSDHRGPQHPARASGVDRHPQPDGQFDQHHDAGRSGTGHRHPGRRGNGRDREHSHPDGAHAVDGSRRAPGEHGNRGPAPAGALVHPVGVHPLVHHGRGPCALCSCRCRWPSAGRWSRRTCFPARSCRFSASGCSRIDTERTARPTAAEARPGFFVRMQNRFERVVDWTVAHRLKVVLAYLLATGTVVVLVGSQLGRELFPRVDTGQFQLRVRPPQGHPVRADHQGGPEDARCDRRRSWAKTRSISRWAMRAATRRSSRSTWPTSGAADPMTACCASACAKGAESTSSSCRSGCARFCPRRWAHGSDRSSRAWASHPIVAKERAADIIFAFEPGDLISQTMSLGAPAPIEVVVSGRNMADSSSYMDELREQFDQIASLRDMQVQQSLHYPTVQVTLDRERAGLSGVTARDIGQSLIAATYSSRYTSRNFWRDDVSGNSYQVQVQVPQPKMTEATDVELVPLTMQSNRQQATRPADSPSNPTPPLLIRDVARVMRSEMPGEVDRYNMRRYLSMTANIEGEDLGRVINRLDQAMARASRPPRGIEVDLRGQVQPMREMFRSLAIGLAVAVVVILIMLTAYFQAPRLAVTAVASVPAVLCGVVLALWITRTTLNIESFMGAIMAVGVAVSNAIMLVSFGDRHRREEGMPADHAAITAAKGRLRPIIMTGCAMIAGMIPMSLALEEGSEQNAPLGRAVIGGMALATFATLLVLPAVFTLLLGRASNQSPSLDPDDPGSTHYDPIEPTHVASAGTLRTRWRVRPATPTISGGSAPWRR